MSKEPGFNVELPLSFEAAVTRVREALKQEGFGVLTEIDLRAAFREKLSREFRPYVILGACNPPLAFSAISADPSVGLLLPCNVTVEWLAEERTDVRLTDPEALLSAVVLQGAPELTSVARDARERMVRVAESLAKGRHPAFTVCLRKEELMTRQLHTASFIQMLLIALIIVTPAFGQGGRGGRGMMGDAAHAADMQLFHQLFEHRMEINRQVVARNDGIEAVTESKNPEVTHLLQTHVTSMLARVKEGRPIHQRDPLFVELFKNADRIEATHELTTGGVRVIETSKDAYVVKLLQAHAEVVSAFLANGMSEMMKNHPVPPR